ncbi:MAG: hypothetical protein L3V56_09615 [Candidatus Magnetoovum sp. WYHC-5]|nr:hypothetical protein [Candidatus Magnetoovum sp. WYHC-5]
MNTHTRQNQYPDEVTIDGTIYQFEKVLKEDFFSVNILYKGANNKRFVLKISDFRFIFGFMLRPLAVFFSKREYALYNELKDVEYVPSVGPRYGKNGFFHAYIEGKTLHEITPDSPLPDDFFERLKTIIDELHKRRIFYLDLNKLGNILVSNDMSPYLIDFQISMPFKRRNGLIGKLTDHIFNLLVKEDIYHIYKHKKRFKPYILTEQEDKLTKKTILNTWYDRLFGTPYRKIKRLIYPKGSNEIIWYNWKKRKK